MALQSEDSRPLVLKRVLPPPLPLDNFSLSFSVFFLSGLPISQNVGLVLKFYYSRIFLPCLFILPSGRFLSFYSFFIMFLNFLLPKKIQKLFLGF